MPSGQGATSQTQGGGSGSSGSGTLVQCTPTNEEPQNCPLISSNSSSSAHSAPLPQRVLLPYNTQRHSDGVERRLQQHGTHEPHVPSTEALLNFVNQSASGRLQGVSSASARALLFSDSGFGSSMSTGSVTSSNYQATSSHHIYTTRSRAIATNVAAKRIHRSFSDSKYAPHGKVPIVGRPRLHQGPPPPYHIAQQSAPYSNQQAPNQTLPSVQHPFNLQALLHGAPLGTDIYGRRFVRTASFGTSRVRK